MPSEIVGTSEERDSGEVTTLAYYLILVMRMMADVLANISALWLIISAMCGSGPPRSAEAHEDLIKTHDSVVLTVEKNAGNRHGPFVTTRGQNGGEVIEDDFAFEDKKEPRQFLRIIRIICFQQSSQQVSKQ